MKLWLISQSVNNDYDTYDSAVVACETEEEAKHSHPSGYYKWDEDAWAFQHRSKEQEKEGRTTSCWTDPENVSVQLIGESVDGVSGVVCSSFNAG